MCIIGIKTKDSKNDLNTWLEYIDNMEFSNCDGGGIVLISDDRVTWTKGTCNTEYIKRLFKRHFYKDVTIIVHFRIATSGLINDRMSHPFLCSKKRGNKLHGELKNNEVLILQNGIFWQLHGYKKSDTFIMTEILKKDVNTYSDNPELALIKMQDYGGDSALVVVSKNEFGVGGTFIIDGGDYFSNDGYKELTETNWKTMDIKDWQNNKKGVDCGTDFYRYEFEKEDDLEDDYKNKDFLCYHERYTTEEEETESGFIETGKKPDWMLKHGFEVD